MKIPVLSSAYILSFKFDLQPGSFRPLISSKERIFSLQKAQNIKYKEVVTTSSPVSQLGELKKEEEIKSLTITEDEMSVYNNFICLMKIS